jgi:hypothetical protein
MEEDGFVAWQCGLSIRTRDRRHRQGAEIGKGLVRILGAVNLKGLPGYKPVILKIHGFLQQTKFVTHGQHFLHHSQYPLLHMSLRRAPRPQRSLLVILPSWFKMGSISNIFTKSDAAHPENVTLTYHIALCGTCECRRDCVIF